MSILTDVLSDVFNEIMMKIFSFIIVVVWIAIGIWYFWG